MYFHKYIFVLLVVGIVAGVMAMAQTAHAEGQVPGIWLDQPPLTPSQKRLFRDYPDALSCLPEEERNKETPDLNKFDWSSVGNDDHAMICVYRIAEELGTPGTLGDWFRAYGFEVFGPQQDEQRGTGAKPVNLWASRSLDGQWPLYPGWISINRYVSRMFYYGYVIHIRWFNGGELGSVQISYSAL